jgi:hypothetical protein
MIFSTLATALGTAAGTAGTAAGTAGAATAGAASVGTAASSLSTAASIAGIGSSLAGTAMGFIGQKKQHAAMEKAEKARERQMLLDAQRQRRQIVRESIMARSTALANATAQGAEGGSGVQGGMAQIAADAARGLTYTNQSESLGQTIFSANREASRGATLASAGSGLVSLGGMIQDSAPAFGRLTEYYSRRSRPAFVY